MQRLRNLFELWGILGLVAIFGAWLFFPGVSWALLAGLWMLGLPGKIVAVALVTLAVIGIVGWILVEGIAYVREWTRQFREWRKERREFREASGPYDGLVPSGLVAERQLLASARRELNVRQAGRDWLAARENGVRFISPFWRMRRS